MKVRHFNWILDMIIPVGLLALTIYGAIVRFWEGVFITASILVFLLFRLIRRTEWMGKVVGMPALATGRLGLFRDRFALASALALGVSFLLADVFVFGTGPEDSGLIAVTAILFLGALLVLLRRRAG